MLRLRKTDGVSVCLQDDFKFLEICDTQGRVAELFIDREDGSIQQLSAGSPEARRYAELFGVEFCEVKELD